MEWDLCSCCSPTHPPRAGHLIEEWNVAMCRMAYDRMTHQSSTTCGEVNSTTTSYPLFYTNLRHRLEASDLRSGELEATLSRELLDHLVASHDASGLTLTYLMHMLSQRKPLQRALRDELRHSTASESAPCTQRDINTLQLLNAILMQTLRLYSANPGPWPRGVPAAGCQVGPFPNIPADAVVSASSYTLHRNAAVFPQPEQWRLERWLDAGVERRSEMMMRWFWACGSGARVCIGRYFAIQSTFVRSWLDRVQNFKAEEC